MNYELAKNLKDSEFPLKVASQADSNHHHEMFQYGKDSIGRDNTWWLEPSLSELIEACGEEITIQGTKKIGYRAYNSANIDYETGIYNENADGATPEEAVANLWLALNKKDA